LVYCVCSLEPEEGVDQIAALLQRVGSLERRPVLASEVGGRPEFLSEIGDLRTWPCQLPAGDQRLGGLDGFYAARLQRL
jgi:16S rRNA (cytosine967-C5)-methyltransferase